MTPTEIDRVFGRGRLRMVTGDHVEVFREASAPGERRCYTKRFLATPDGDFREWTEREWRILARLVGHGLKPVPEIVQFDRGSADRPALVQTYDAGITVDHWATLLPLERDGVLLKNVFEDCAHWWALARHTLVALDAIHELRLVHLDLKADNVCIPVGPAGFDPRAGSERALHPCFDDLTLIDFAFSVVSGERLKSALPIAAQPDYEYQSPRLLQALEQGRSGDLGMTRHLDWRCDFFSLAAMLWRYLPEPAHALDRGWTTERHEMASAFVRHLVEVHDLELPALRPHALLIAQAADVLAAPDLHLSLQRGWTLAYDASAPTRARPTPITRIAPPLAVAVPEAAASAATRPEARVSPVAAVAPGTTPISPPPVPVAGDPAFMPLPMPMHVEQSDIDARAETRSRQAQRRPSAWWWGAGLAAAAVAATPWLLSPWTANHDADAAPATTPVAELAPVASPAASASVAVAVASAPAAISAVLQPPAPVVAEPSAPLPATAAIAPGREPVRSAPVAHVAPPTANVSPLKPRLVARAEATVAPRPTPVTVRSARAAAAEAANAARLAKAHDDAAALMRARAGRAATPDTAAAPTAFPGRGADGPTPWAVAGRPPTATAPARGAMTPTPTQTQTQTQTPTPTPTPVPVPSQPGTPVPLAVAPEVRNLPVDAAGDSDRPDWAARADEIMASYVPRVAQRAERTVSRTLFLAGRSDNVVGDVEVSSSAAQLGRTAGDVPSLVLAGREAESLAAGARSEFARRGATREAIQLQVRSFGANPLDPNGAGYLAFLLLRQRPAQAEAARQLALYALTMRGGRYPVGRPEDWTTLAVANALLGRQRDAQNALLVSLAASPSVERQCRAALDLVSLYGDRLRAPAEALLRSAQSSNARASSLCEWPPYWAATTSTR